MSYNSSKYVRPEEIFSGGYVDNTPNEYLGDKYSPFLRNARLEGHAIKIRPWHELRATLTSWDFPRGIWASSDYLLVRHNQGWTQRLVRINLDGTVIPIETAALINSNNRSFFQNTSDGVYQMNGVDRIGLYNWSTYAQLTDDLSPAFSTVFAWSHWIAWGTLNNEVQKSVADDFSDFSWTWSDTLTFQENITSLEANNQTLYIFTNGTISAIGSDDISVTAGTTTFNTRVITTKEGAANNASTVQVGYNIYYLTPSNKINQIARGNNLSWFEVIELSERKYRGINNILNTLDPDQSESWWEYYPKENIIKWLVRTRWATFNDLCIIYDISRDAFLVDEQKYFYHGIKTDFGNYTISNIEPKVYRDEINQDDDDDPIEFEYWTKEFDLGDPTRKKILWEMRSILEVNELAELVQEIYIDWGLVDTRVIDRNDIVNIQAGIWWPAVAELSIWEWTDEISMTQEVNLLRTKWNLNVKWRRIQLRYRCNTLAAEALLRDAQFRVEVLNPLADNIS